MPPTPPPRSSAIPTRRTPSGSVSETIRKFEARSVSSSSTPPPTDSSPAASRKSTTSSIPRISSISSLPNSTPQGSPSKVSGGIRAPKLWLGEPPRSGALSERDAQRLGMGVPSSLRRRASETPSLRPRGTRTSVHGVVRPMPSSSSVPRSLSTNYGAEPLPAEVDDFSPVSSPIIERSRPSVEALGTTPEKRLPPLRRRSDKSETGSPGRTSRGAIPIPNAERRRELSRGISAESTTPSVYYTPASPSTVFEPEIKEEERIRTESIINKYLLDESEPSSRRTSAGGVYFVSKSSRSPSPHSPLTPERPPRPDSISPDSYKTPVLASIVLPSDLSRRLSNRPRLHHRASSTSSLSVRGWSQTGSRLSSPGESPLESPLEVVSRESSPSHRIQSSTTTKTTHTPTSPAKFRGTSKNNRRDPGLTITPPLPPGRIPSTSSSSLPTPPIPLKSPLRRLSSATGSGDISRNSSIGSQEGRGLSTAGGSVARKESLESVLANVGTPLTARSRQTRMEEAEMGDGLKPRAKTPVSATSTVSALGRSLAEAAPSKPLESPVTVPAPSPAPKQREPSIQDEIRFSMVVPQSVYSQDSAPSSATSWAGSGAGSGSAAASTPKSAESSTLYTARERPRDQKEKRRPLTGVITGHFPWGKGHEKRSSVDSTKSGLSGHRRSNSLPRPRLVLADDHGLATQSPEEMSAATFSSAGFESNSGPTSLTPLPITPITPSHSDLPQTSGLDKSPAKSPSLPILRTFPPISTEMPSPRRSETAGALSSLLSPSGAGGGIPTSSSMQISKRRHLLREIADSEQAYARDLALVRDAFMFARPVSTYSFDSGPSSGAGGGSTTRILPSRTASISRGASRSKERTTRHDKRNSIYTYQTEGSRSSLVTSPTTPLPKSPSDSFANYFSRSSISLHGSSQGPASASAAGSISQKPGATGGTAGMMAPPVGKPLSPSDVKAVFLNLDQVASVAEELAVMFDAALGEGDEEGQDRVGKVFVEMVPKLRPLYIYYCARQSSASRHLSSLSSHPSTSTHLSLLWSSISPYTHAWNLDSMLIKPVQRLTKYPLLFEDLLKVTGRDHADYFWIKRAGEEIRGLVAEVDERTRRKGLVENALGKPVGNAGGAVIGMSGGMKDKEKKEGGLLSLKRFKKEKDRSGSSSVTTSSTAYHPPGIQLLPSSSLTTLTALSTRLSAFQTHIPSLGQSILLWTAAAKETWRSQDELAKVWLRVVRLEPSDLGDNRLIEWRRVVDFIVQEAWEVLSKQIKLSILPPLSTLLSTLSPPQTILQKRQALLPSYNRYHNLASSSQTNGHGTAKIEKTLSEAASEFVALHLQLVEELPVFLDGCEKVIGIVVGGFAKVQATYFNSVEERVRGFTVFWIQTPLGVVSSSTSGSDEDERQAREEDGSSDQERHRSRSENAGKVMEGREVVHQWYELWKDYAGVMEGFECVKPSFKPPKLAIHLASPSLSRTGTRRGQPHIHTSQSDLDLPSPTATLRHSASSTVFPPTSSGGSMPSSPNGKIKRSRASSLRETGAHSVVAGDGKDGKDGKDVKESGSRFSLLMRSNSKSNIAKPRSSLPTSSNTSSSMTKPTHIRRNSNLRPSTLPISAPMASSFSSSSDMSRISWGLPQIPAENGGLGIGLSPPGSVESRFGSPRMRGSPFLSPGATQGPSVGPSRNNTPDLRGAEYIVESPVVNAASPAQQHLATPLNHPYASKTGSTVVDLSGSQSSLGGRDTSALAGLGIGDVGQGHPFNPRPPSSRVPSSGQDLMPRDEGGGRRERVNEMDVSEGWRDENVIYQCACVADFDPLEWGNRKYRGLWFLSMMCGDLIDVFHEVGRIEDLPSFPYPSLGVDNDGVLVGRAENGEIGLVICSFVEPLRY